MIQHFSLGIPTTPHALHINMLNILCLHYIQPEYEDFDSLKCAIVDAALSSVDGSYETIIQLPKSMYEIPNYLPNTMIMSPETEKQLYDEPIEIQKDYGPIYQEPPSSVKKIYEKFEGKHCHKINHHDIRCVVPHV